MKTIGSLARALAAIIVPSFWIEMVSAWAHGRIASPTVRDTLQGFRTHKGAGVYITLREILSWGRMYSPDRKEKDLRVDIMW